MISPAHSQGASEYELFGVLPKWSRQGIANRPARIQSFMNDVIRQSCFPRPLGNRKPLAAERNAHRRRPRSRLGSVAGLLLSSRPSYVPRFVVPILVWIAVHAVLLGWSRTNVSNEKLKGIEPAFTHFDAAATIPLVLRVRSPSAAFDHRVPASVFERSREPVNVASFGGGFARKASATSSCSPSQVVVVNEDLVSAITNALPNQPIPFIPPSKSFHQQSPKRHSGQVLLVCTENTRFGGVWCEHNNNLLSNAEKVKRGVSSLT